MFLNNCHPLTLGILNPLDCPHHLRANEVSKFREGVTLDKPVNDDLGSYVDVGLGKDIRIDKHLQPNIRVTVKVIKFLVSADFVLNTFSCDFSYTLVCDLGLILVN